MVQIKYNTTSVDGVKILAHRGFSRKFPENTGLSFLKALEYGADGIECDIQKTRDGKFVVIHDESIQRTGNGEGRLRNLTLSDLKAFDFGAGEKILELEELLDRIPKGKWINIEIKRDTIESSDCAEIAELILKKRGTQEVLISSFSLSLLPIFRKKGFRTGALIGPEWGEVGIGILVFRLLQIRPAYLHLPIQSIGRVDPSMIQKLSRGLRMLGIGTVFYTVNFQEDFEKVADFSDFIITDEVELAVQWRQGLGSTG